MATIPIEKYIAPEDISHKTFCLQRIINSAEDDYCYLDIYAEVEGKVIGMCVVYNYPPCFAASIQDMEQQIDAGNVLHGVKFLDDGTLEMCPGLARDCICQKRM